MENYQKFLIENRFQNFDQKFFEIFEKSKFSLDFHWKFEIFEIFRKIEKIKIFIENFRKIEKSKNFDFPKNFENFWSKILIDFDQKFLIVFHKLFLKHKIFDFLFSKIFNENLDFSIFRKFSDFRFFEIFNEFSMKIWNFKKFEKLCREIFKINFLRDY